MRAALIAFRSVLANPEIRFAQLGWMASRAGEGAYVVSLLVYAYTVAGVAGAGLLTAVRTIPAGLLSAPLASLSDSQDRRRLLIIVQTGRAALIAGSAVAVGVGLSPVTVFGLAIVEAMLAVLHRPTFMSLLPAMARSPQELVASNVAASTGENAGQLIGPALAGVLLVISAAWVSLAAAAALVAVAALSAAGIRRRPSLRPTVSEGPAAAMLGGARALLRYPHARLLVGLFSAQTLVRGMLMVLIVASAVGPLGLGHEGVGYLNAAIGAGGFVGALAAAAYIGQGRLAPAFGLGLLLWGLPIAIIGLLSIPVAAVVGLVVVGGGNAILDISGFTLLQRTVPNAVRGRVLGIVETMVMLTVGLGSLIAPLLVTQLGIRGALVVTGLILPTVAFITWRRVWGIDANVVIPARELELLRGVAIFRPLPLTILEQLADDLQARHFARGEPLIVHGETGDRFYILASGSAEVMVEGAPVRRLAAGDSCGEIALLRDIPRTASVVATDAVEAFTLERDAFVAAVTGDLTSGRVADALIDTRLAKATIDAQ